MESPLFAALVHVPLGLALSLPVLATGLVLWGGRASLASWRVVLFLQGLACVSAFLALQFGPGDTLYFPSGEQPEVLATSQRASQVFSWSAVLAFVVGAIGHVLPQGSLRRRFFWAFACTLWLSAVLAYRVDAVRTGEEPTKAISPGNDAPPAGGEVYRL